MLNLLSPTEHLASLQWFEFSDGIRFLTRRRGCRAHQKWLRKRNAGNPILSQAAPVVLDLLISGADEQSGEGGDPSNEASEAEAKEAAKKRQRQEKLSELLMDGRVDLVGYLGERAEMDREEALELIEDWDGIVDLKTGEVEPYTKERAKWFLEIEDLLPVDGDLVPFGDHLTKWVIQRSDELEAFQAKRERGAEKNSEASSGSSSGEASSKTTNPAPSIAN